VTVPNPQQALQLVQAQPWGQQARLDDEQKLLTAGPDGSGRALNLFLVQAGFVPELLERSKQDLEEVFLHLTNGSTGDIK
jgi:ABC-2 type transport system ATP-binding protein